MAGTCRVTGVTETRAALARLGQQIHQATEEATAEAAQELHDFMYDAVPVDTGETQSTLAIIDGEEEGTKAVGFVDSQAIPFIEFGTSDTPAQPTLLPAAEVERSKFPERVGDHVKEAIE